ncbi:hypothetical protein [Shewanella algae]|uniref:HNH endonuclease n=1 Tax=Shewanella algae TaxID=38313 RepID=UPI0031F4891A
MIKQLTSRPNIDQQILDGIEGMKPFKGGDWDIKNNYFITSFKESLREKLLIIQGYKCAYCGLRLGETGKIEIEHIAPKGGAKRPKHIDFMFTISNLVLSCNLCNSPIKKGSSQISVDWK